MLDETVDILQSVNALGKVMNQTILPPVGQTGFSTLE